MDENTMLEMLKITLGITVTAYDLRLAQLLTVAKEAIEREGATLNTAFMSDADLVVQYAAWMWAKRDTGEAIPRMLRWRLNNRIFGEKARS